MFSSRDQFVKELEKQESFKPSGHLIKKYSVVNAGRCGFGIGNDWKWFDKITDGEKQQFEVFKVSESSPQFDSYLARVQTLSLWYIDAAEYTDNSDERWMHYFVYVLFHFFVRVLLSYSFILSCSHIKMTICTMCSLYKYYVARSSKQKRLNGCHCRYEKIKGLSGGDCFALAGYVSVYNFYAYPQHVRPRIA